ncbi:MAG: zinc-ribbon domain-containing protein [Acutalibacteraceae bacterium]|jgi:ribosomal protein L40E
MAQYCSNCGSPLEAGAAFCQKCGAAQTPPVSPAPVCAGNGPVRQGIPAPGYSDRVNHPEILAAVRKGRRRAGIFALFLVPLPLIGFVIYSFVNEELALDQAALYGGILSAVFLLFALYGFVKERAKNAYEATVIDKKSRLVERHRSADENAREMITEYVVVARTAQGKKKKIVEQEGSRILAWQYLQVGDRFRYHPQFHFPYELYDKSRAPYIACVSCPAHNPVEADRCQRCGLPLLK